MKVIKHLLLGIILSLILASCVSQEAIGGLIVDRIEQYRIETNRLPDWIYGTASRYNDFWNMPKDIIDSLVSGKQYSLYEIKGQELWFVKDTSPQKGTSVFEIKGTTFCYEKIDSVNYTVWFGTVLGESVIYNSDTQQWVDTCKPNNSDEFDVRKHIEESLIQLLVKIVVILQ